MAASGLRRRRCGLGYGVFVATVAIATFVGTTPAFAAVGTWQSAGAQTAPNGVVTAGVRLSDGRVLIAGGIVSDDSVATTQIFDPTTTSWTAADDLGTPRGLASTTVLADGKVLVAGGTQIVDGAATPLATAELYDPATDSWAPTGTMLGVRSEHTATRLLDGRVLVVGGYDECCAVPTAEIFDPTTGTWSATGALHIARVGHAATLLGDGRVLVSGGELSLSPSVLGLVGYSEIWDPGTGKWTMAGSLATPRAFFAAALLADGRVLAAGGTTNTTDPYQEAGASAEIYDPATDTWTPTGSLATAREYVTATLLPNGRVLVAGGLGNDPVSQVKPLATAEVFNPATGTWLAAKSMPQPRFAFAAVSLLSGEVLVAGGYSRYPPVANRPLTKALRYVP